ncbi:hypothetical protein MKW98_022023 [Papaver atlanticum]|uniref:O-methyltransferase C-terminal domain-containing protein n=1 Tax=Papaver atlanticum TaxID=357466 RepID=A0AAD4XXN3_9MAGN|nr:hypothetical protein MKW98_022023 [Papaver atlanticum]
MVVRSQCLKSSKGLKTTTPSASSPNVEYLTRIMRLLVHNRVFTSHQLHQQSDEMLYDLTRSSKWLLKDSEFNLSNVVLFETDPILLKPWQYLGKCVRESGTFPFEEAYGCRIWEYAASNPQFNDFLNSALQGTISTVINEMLVAYKDGFNGITTLVDVGGSTGSMIAQIVAAYPHIQGINFDLPHAVAAAPDYPGVKHVGGDMFVHIPEADAIIMKSILHDWNDEYCATILKNCYKAISKKKNGKVILVEGVIQPGKDDTFDKVGLMFDLVMIAHASAGKERTEEEWKILLNNAGFPRYNIIKTTAFCSIIEAFPE